MLSVEVIDHIATLVRSGFYGQDELTYLFCEEIYEPGELSKKEVRAAVNVAFSRWNEDKKSWADVTDCDRLDKVFDALNARGIIALQNAGYTQSDGYSDIREEYAELADKSNVSGYCFYHGQDLERVVRGGGLDLAFGPVDPSLEDTKGPEVGRIIQEELERVGFRVNWDGTFAKRINIPVFEWKKR